MSHRPITEDDLHAYVDSVLEPERQAKVAAYLNDHPDVARRVAVFADQRELLRAALAPIAEEPLPTELDLSRIIEQHSTRPPLIRWAAAALMLVSLGGLGGWSIRSALQAPSGELIALGQEAAVSYNVYAPDRVRPVEFRASENDQLVRWVSDRLRRPVKVPDLTTAGYRLMGGRVVATAHGPAAMFMYDDDHDRRLVVLARAMSRAGQNAPMTPRSQGDVSGFAWADDGLGYSLMGHAAPESLRSIANEIRRQAGSI